MNSRTNNGSTTSFTVDIKNQVSAVAGASYSYDGNGNLIWGTNSHNQYVYDDENQLTQWFYYSAGQQPVSGDLRTDFVYDGRSRLRSRSEYQYVGSAWSLSAITTYMYDGLRVIQERVGGTPTVSYTRGTDIGGTLEHAGGIGGLLARSSGYSGGNWSTHYFYHADGNANITYLVDSNQGLAASYRYDPFGNIISSSGSLAAANVYRFSSKEIHANSGMYYYLYRFYDPNLQRWINADPAGEKAGFNLHTFSHNKPVSAVDPLGLQIISFIFAGTGANDANNNSWMDKQIAEVNTILTKCQTMGFGCVTPSFAVQDHFWDPNDSYVERDDPPVQGPQGWVLTNPNDVGVLGLDFLHMSRLAPGRIPVLLTYASITTSRGLSSGSTVHTSSGNGIILSVSDPFLIAKPNALAHELGHYFGYQAELTNPNNIMYRSLANMSENPDPDELYCSLVLEH